MLACSLSLVLVPIVWANDPNNKFDLMDANRDGQISREEHTAGAQRMFAEIDTNNDGLITATEMESKFYADKGQRGAGEMSARDKIKEIDLNADGRLTRTEHAQGSESMFGKMDANRDGSLSRDELAAGHKSLKHDDRGR
jgi:Ca2+-binding EF-hand superfamily protein